MSDSLQEATDRAHQPTRQFCCVIKRCAAYSCGGTLGNRLGRRNVASLDSEWKLDASLSSGCGFTIGCVVPCQMHSRPYALRLAPTAPSSCRTVLLQLHNWYKYDNISGGTETPHFLISACRLCHSMGYKKGHSISCMLQHWMRCIHCFVSAKIPA